MNLKEYIEARGLTQRGVAKAAGVEPASLSKWISGETTPRFAGVQKIADALGITLGMTVNLINGYEDTPTDKITGAEIVLAQNEMKLLRDMTYVMLCGDVPKEAAHAMTVACCVLSHNNNHLLSRERLMSEVKIERPEEITREDAYTAAVTLQNMLLTAETVKRQTSFVFYSDHLKTAIKVLLLAEKA